MYRVPQEFTETDCAGGTLAWHEAEACIVQQRAAAAAWTDNGRIYYTIV